MPFQFNAIARLGTRNAGQSVGVNFSASTGWGMTPATLTVVGPRDAFNTIVDQVNDLTISQQGSPGVSAPVAFFFRDVITRSVDEAEPSDAGLVKITMEDRRWRWQFGSIDGDYNVVKEDGTLKREKTPRELAILLSLAMGEQGMDVKDLPNVARPRKIWRGHSPASELEQLCRDLGCVVVFNGHRNTAAIRRVGYGAAIPQQPIVSEARGIAMAAWPSEIVIDTSPVLFQRGLLFYEAVGLDTDGKIKPIDQLSYKPAAGWGLTDPIDFIDIDGVFTSDGQQVYARDLAAKTVWKWYRLTGLDGGGFCPAALLNEPNKPSSRDDIGPFLDTRLDRDFATDNRLPMEAIGSYYDDRENFENTKARAKVKIDFSINDKTKCVEFTDPVYLLMPEAAQIYQPAQIKIYAGFSVSVNGVPVRFQRIRSITGSTYNAGPRVEIKDEIVREIVEQAPFSQPARDNRAKVYAECDSLLEAMVAEYQKLPTANPTLPYLADFYCDGILRSIQWDAGSTDAVTTQLAYNGELNEYLPDIRDTPAARAKREADRAARQRQAIQNGQLKPAPAI